jgi:hypothetical protein
MARLGEDERAALIAGLPNDGLCLCGCGESTPIAINTNVRKGHVAGHPMRYVRGHNRRGKIQPPRYEVRACGYGTPCWMWLLKRDDDGYGRYYIGEGVFVPAYRYFYEQAHGPIHPRAQIDHLCRNPPCVNPAHLEPVTRAENIRRGRTCSLTYDDVDEIRSMLAAGYTQKAIAQQFGVSSTTIRSIKRGRSWALPGGALHLAQVA